MTTRSFLYTQAEAARKARTENFTVASRLLPHKVRRHLLAFYAYARMVDDMGDAHEGDRLEALEAVEAQVKAALKDHQAPDVWPIVAEAAGSVSDLGADPQPLFDLIAANRQDQFVREYETFDDLVAYCALSAQPVGRLVLSAFRVDNQENVEWSDCICTGLQLAEHWQDVAEDAASGRVYVPKEDLDRFGVNPSAFSSGQPADKACRALMVFEVARARRILDAGKPLIPSLTGTCRWAVAGFWAGGHAALDGIAARDFDVLTGSPHTSRIRAAGLAIRVMRGASKGSLAA